MKTLTTLVSKGALVFLAVSTAISANAGRAEDEVKSRFAELDRTIAQRQIREIRAFFAPEFQAKKTAAGVLAPGKPYIENMRAFMGTSSASRCSTKLHKITVKGNTAWVKFTRVARHTLKNPRSKKDIAYVTTLDGVETLRKQSDGRWLWVQVQIDREVRTADGKTLPSG